MSGHDDPTLAFIERLEDPTLYRVVDNMPVFVPHSRKIKNEKTGKVTEVVVTEADLPDVAKEANRRFEEDGVPGVLTLGHRDPRKTETEQPPVVGATKDYRVGTFGPQNKPCVLATGYIRRDREDEAREYPFRSVDYYPGKKQITGVALLKRDPQLDMGMVTYREPAGLIIRYVRDTEMADDLDPTMPPGTPMKDDDEGAAEEYRKHCYSHPYAKKYHEQMCAQYGGMAFPSGTNGALPGGEPPALPPPPADDEAARMQRDSQAIRYARDQREREELRKQVNQLQSERNKDRAETRVIQLQAEGYLIPDRAKEVQKMAAMTTDAQRDERVEEIRLNYHRDPTAGLMLPVGDDVDAPQSGKTPDERPRPLGGSSGADLRYHGGTDLDKRYDQYLRAHVGADYEEAMSYARGEISLHGQPVANGHAHK